MQRDLTRYEEQENQTRARHTAALMASAETDDQPSSSPSTTPSHSTGKQSTSSASLTRLSSPSSSSTPDLADLGSSEPYDAVTDTHEASQSAFANSTQKVPTLSSYQTYRVTTQDGPRPNELELTDMEYQVPSGPPASIFCPDHHERSPAQSDSSSCHASSTERSLSWPSLTPSPQLPPVPDSLQNYEASEQGGVQAEGSNQSEDTFWRGGQLRVS